MGGTRSFLFYLKMLFLCQEVRTKANVFFRYQVGENVFNHYVFGTVLSHQLRNIHLSPELVRITTSFDLSQIFSVAKNDNNFFKGSNESLQGRLQSRGFQRL
jgi:hypothetical protein